MSLQPQSDCILSIVSIPLLIHNNLLISHFVHRMHFTIHLLPHLGWSYSIIRSLIFSPLITHDHNKQNKPSQCFSTSSTVYQSLGPSLFISRVWKDSRDKRLEISVELIKWIICAFCGLDGVFYLSWIFCFSFSPFIIIFSQTQSWQEGRLFCGFVSV